mmetsp:Transcript_31871/g.62371  ORF Transcript_31871/g.62371 Transcript_31871/m.62371 type:complete len:282 (-) Transcript_31871:429-1274(-)
MVCTASMSFCSVPFLSCSAITRTLLRCISIHLKCLARSSIMPMIEDSSSSTLSNFAAFSISSPILRVRIPSFANLGAAQSWAMNIPKDRSSSSFAPMSMGFGSGGRRRKLSMTTPPITSFLIRLRATGLTVPFSLLLFESRADGSGDLTPVPRVACSGSAVSTRSCPIVSISKSSIPSESSRVLLLSLLSSLALFASESSSNSTSMTLEPSFSSTIVSSPSEAFSFASISFGPCFTSAFFWVFPSSTSALFGSSLADSAPLSLLPFPGAEALPVDPSGWVE